MVYTTHKNGDLGDGLWHCFNHRKKILIFMGFNSTSTHRRISEFPSPCVPHLWPGWCHAMSSRDGNGWNRTNHLPGVGGFNPTPLKNDGVKVSWDDEIPNCFWKVIKSVPNHQPVFHSSCQTSKLLIQCMIMWACELSSLKRKAPN
jgi:hypothetical protein